MNELYHTFLNTSMDWGAYLSV